jgi:hypothetical protein
LLLRYTVVARPQIREFVSSYCVGCTVTVYIESGTTTFPALSTYFGPCGVRTKFDD